MSRKTSQKTSGLQKCAISIEHRPMTMPVRDDGGLCLVPVFCARTFQGEAETVLWPYDSDK